MRHSFVFVLFVLLLASTIHAQESRSLTLATAQPLNSDQISATGRVHAKVSAKIGPRVTGHLIEFGKDADGRMLDVGMRVKKGDVLFRLNETTFRNALGVSEAAVASAKASLANLTAETREEQIDQLRQALAELDTRLADKEKDEQRYRRLVEQDKTMPARRLEEVQVDLAAMRAQRQAAAARLRMAEKGATNTEIAIAQAAVNQAEATRKIAQDDLRDTAVLAPFDGMITQRFKGPGDYLTSGPPTDVLELTATDDLEAELRVPESYLAMIEPGKTMMTLRSPLLKGDLKLLATRVVSMIDAAKGTFAVRVAIPVEKRGGLVPGAFVTAGISLQAESGGVIVPQRAVVETSGQAVVLVAEGGKMSKRSVTLGDRLTEGVIVTSGLSAGQVVIVGPADSLADGADLPEYLRK